MPAYRVDSFGRYIDLATGIPLDTFILGETMPTAENSGLNAYGVDPGDLEDIGGTVYIDTPNTVYEGVRFTGRVVNRAPGTRFKTCWFNGPHTGSTTAILRLDNENSSDVELDGCLLQPSSFATVGSEALETLIFGDKFTLYRCDLSGAIDLIGLYSGVDSSTPAQDVSVLGSYMHDQLYYSPFPAQSDNRSHSDGIQVHYGLLNFLLEGTYMSGLVDPTKGQADDDAVYSGGDLVSGNPDKGFYRTLSGMMFSPRNSTAGHAIIHILRNWLGGGSGTIMMPSDLTWATDVVIDGNRWIETPGPMWGPDEIVRAPASQPLTIQNNIKWPSGTPYNGRVNS